MIRTWFFYDESQLSSDNEFVDFAEYYAFIMLVRCKTCYSSKFRGSVLYHWDRPDLTYKMLRHQFF